MKRIVVYGLFQRHSIDNTFPIYLPKFTKRELYLWYLKIIKPLLKLDIQYRKNIYSSIPLDIIIPTIDKDIDLLEEVIVAAKKHIKHPIKNIFIISNEDTKLKNIISKHSCIFIDEKSLLPISKESISYAVNGIDRSGWLFQQLLKLSADKIATQEHFLVIDSDTIFLKPKVFEYKKKFIYDHSEERHIPYYDVYLKLMKIPARSSFSFISHYMLFSKQYLKEMKNYIESKNKRLWYEAILDNVDYSNISGFSEYETYGNYMFTFHKNKIRREFWYNLSCCEQPSLISNYYKSLSIHSYRRRR